MLKKLEILLLASVFSFALLSSLSFAISCRSCNVNSCICSVDECSSGLMRIYPSSSCTIPKYEYEFSQSQFTWDVAPLGKYYFKAFCTNGQTTDCIGIQVAAAGATTTTIKTTTTIRQTTTTTIKSIGGQGDYTWALIALILLIAIFIVILLFFRVFKKKPKKTFEEVYKKWGK